MHVSVSVREDASLLRECPRGDSPGGSACPGVAGGALTAARRARRLRVRVWTWGAGRAPPPRRCGRVSASVRTCGGGVRGPVSAVRLRVPHPHPRLGADWLGAVTGRPPPGAAAAAAGAGARVCAVCRRVRRGVRPAAGCAGERGSAPTRRPLRPSWRVRGAPARPARPWPPPGAACPPPCGSSRPQRQRRPPACPRRAAKVSSSGGGAGAAEGPGRGARCPRLNFLPLDPERQRGWDPWAWEGGGQGWHRGRDPRSRDSAMEMGTGLGDRDPRA